MAKPCCLFSNASCWIVACLEETQNMPIIELHIILHDADALLTLKVNGLTRILQTTFHMRLSFPLELFILTMSFQSCLLA